MATAFQRTRTGLADFFEAGRDPNSDAAINYGTFFFHNTSDLPLSTKSLKNYMYCILAAGRSWKAEELRQKSWEDLHQLWYVCLKEKNMLMSQKQMLLSQNLRMPNPERFPKVLVSFAFKP